MLFPSGVRRDAPMEWNHTEAKYRTRRESLWGCECAGRRALLAQLPLPAATTVLPGHAQTVAAWLVLGQPRL